MNKQVSYGRQIAMGGIFAAVAFVMLSLIPILSNLMVLIAGMAMMLVRIEVNAKTALCSFIVVSVLAYLMIPAPTGITMFFTYIGWYPVVKPSLDKIAHKHTQWLVKAAIFAVTSIPMTLITLFVFGTNRMKNIT